MLVASILLLASVLPAVATSTSLVGQVVAVPSAGGPAALRVRGDSGAEVSVILDASTVFLRARPGATTLAGAEPMKAEEVAAGDRVLCQGTAEADGVSLRARRVVVMTRADVDAAQQKQREDWRRRGVAGVVVTIDPAAHAIVARLRTAPVPATPASAGAPATAGAPAAAPPATITIDASAPAVVFRRYAQGSLKFADARPSAFADVAVGDQLRALGNRSADGSRIVAEQVVSGSFRIVRGVLKESAEGALSVQEEGRNGKLVAVSVADGALVRRLPPFVVARLLRTASGDTAEAPAGPGAGLGEARSGAAAGGSSGAAPGGGPRPGAWPGSAGAGGGNGGGPGGWAAAGCAPAIPTRCSTGCRRWPSPTCGPANRSRRSAPAATTPRVSRL